MGCAPSQASSSSSGSTTAMPQQTNQQTQHTQQPQQPQQPQQRQQPQHALHLKTSSAVSASPAFSSSASLLSPSLSLSPLSPSGLSTSNLTLWDAKAWSSWRIISQKAITPSTFIFKFLPACENGCRKLMPPKFDRNCDHCCYYMQNLLKFPIGNHVFLRYNGLERPYTPIAYTMNGLEIAMKIYENGRFTAQFKHIPLQTVVELKGPAGMMNYADKHFNITGRKLANGKFGTLSLTPNKIGMICGGTGVTPMIQLIRHFVSVSTPTSPSIVPALLYFNVSPLDVPFQKELNDLHSECAVDVTFFVNEESRDLAHDADFKGLFGLIETEHIQERLPPPAPDILILVCGPKAMVTLVNQHLAAIGYTSDMIFVY